MLSLSLSQVGDDAISRALAASAIRSALATVGVRLPPPPLLTQCTSGPIGRVVKDQQVELCLRLMGAVSLSEVSVETMCVLNAVVVIFMVAEVSSNGHDGRMALMRQLWEAAARKEEMAGRAEQCDVQAAEAADEAEPVEAEAAAERAEAAEAVAATQDAPKVGEEPGRQPRGDRSGEGSAIGAGGAISDVESSHAVQEGTAACSECETCVCRRLQAFKRIATQDAASTAKPALQSSAKDGGPAVPAVLSNFAQLLGFWGEVYETHSCERRFLEFSSGIPFAQWLRAVRELKHDLMQRPPPLLDINGSCEYCDADEG